jgi:hypothetical protein
VDGGGQPGGREGGKDQANVPECDVVEVAKQQQVDDDPSEPRGDDVAADAGCDGRQPPGRDLDHAHGEQGLRAVPGRR